MSAIITDQIRILNAKNFVAGVSTSTNSYYAFVGLPNPTSIVSTWDSAPPAPIDSFNNMNDYHDSMLAVKRITSYILRTSLLLTVILGFIFAYRTEQHQKHLTVNHL